jgi:acetyl esterase
MLQALLARLLELLQALKVWGFRKYYRISNARAWRGHTTAGPCTNLRIPLHGASIRARLYGNAHGASKPLVVYMHGGGWVIGDLETHHPFCQALSANGGCLEIDPPRREKIVGQALIYPATDHYSAGFGSYVEKATGQTLTAGIMHWFWDTYLGGLSAQAPAAQRAFPLRSERLASLPATMLVTAENDPLRDEAKAYAAKLQQAGVALTCHHFEGAEHGFACSQGPNADFRGFITQLGSWLAQLA